MIFFYLAMSKMIPATVGIIFVKRMTPAFRWIVAYIWFGLATELVMFALSMAHGSNLAIPHFYHIGETWLIALFIMAAVSSKAIQNVTFICALALTALAVLEMTLIGSLNKFDPITSVAEHIAVIALLGALLYHVAYIRLERPMPSMIIIVFALLIYFISSITYYALLNFLPKSSLLSMAYIHGSVNVVCNLILTVGLWLSTGKQTYTMTYQEQAHQIGLMKELIGFKDRLIEMLRR